MSLVLGIDSSTQSTKVEARDVATGQVAARSASPHPAAGPPSSEQHPHAWWTAAVRAIGDLGAARGDVVAVSVAAQQHGLVLLDHRGEVVRPAPLWNDTRSAAHSDALVERYGASWWARRCGSVLVPSFTITTLAWLADREPQTLERTAAVMLPHDYLTWRLSGSHVTDRGDASGTGWFDPHRGVYDPELLGTVVDSPAAWLERLPRVAGPEEGAGHLTDVAARELDLPPGIPVGIGTGDNMAAALGLGLRPGDLAMSLGTSGTVYSVSETPTADATGSVAGFADATGRFLPLVCTLNATRVTDAVARWLGTDAAGLADLASAEQDDSDGVVLLPYFDGERTPNLPDARGLLAGLTTSTSREQLARAAHDGVLCGLFEGLDALRAAGVETGGTLHLIGGGARSGAYRQRCADLAGHPIVVPDSDETVATGAALQAAALVTGENPADLAEVWRLRDGVMIDPAPSANGRAVRAAYAELRQTQGV